MNCNFLPKMSKLQLKLITMKWHMRYFLTVLIVTIILCSWYMLMYVPLNRMIESTWREMLHDRSLISQRDNFNDAYRQLKNQRQALQASYDVQAKQLSLQEIVFKILEGATSNDLALVSYESGACIRQAHSLKQSLTIHCMGTYESLYRFLHLVYDCNFLLEIKTLSITARDHDVIALMLVLDLIQLVNNDEQNTDIIN